MWEIQVWREKKKQKLYESNVQHLVIPESRPTLKGSWEYVRKHGGPHLKRFLLAEDGRILASIRIIVGMVGKYQIWLNPCIPRNTRKKKSQRLIGYLLSVTENQAIILNANKGKETRSHLVFLVQMILYPPIADNKKMLLEMVKLYKRKEEIISPFYDA